MLMLIIKLSQSQLKTKSNSKYFIEYLDKDIKPLVSLMPKESGYVKAFKTENKNNKQMTFCIDYEKLLEKYKPISTEIQSLKN